MNKQIDKQTCVCIHTYQRLLELWRLKSLTICSLQDGNRGKSVVNSVHIQRHANQGSRGINSSLRAIEDEMRCSRSSNEVGKGQIPTSSTFGSIQAHSRLDDTHPYWGGKSALLNTLI